MTHARLLSMLLPCALAIALASGPADARGFEPRGLVAHYCFETELAKDCSANGNDGVVDGDVSAADGHRGLGAHFGGFGSLGYIRVPNSTSLTLDGDFTIAYWARLDTFAGIDGFNRPVEYGLQIPLAKSHDRSGAFTEFSTLSNDPPPPGSATAPLDVAAIFVGSGSIVGQLPDYTLGDWLHVAYTYQAASHDLKLYLNGRPVATTTLNGVPLAAFARDDLYLGAQAPLFGRNVYQYPFEGVLDGVRLYNRALRRGELFYLVLKGD